VSTHSRLGNDPLARQGDKDSSGGREALRHILDTGAALPEKPQADPSAIYKEVAGKFSEAMDSLSRMAASAGVWAWGERSGEGDPFLFMRLMAAYGVGPQGEGVDLQAFLYDVHDHWERHDIRISLFLDGIVIPIERAFNLARGLQACLDGFCGQGKRAPAPLTLTAGLTASGRVRLRIHGSREHFPSGDPVFGTRGAETLAELARTGAVSILFTASDQNAELVVIA